jgi:hypothetical protein
MKRTLTSGLLAVAAFLLLALAAPPSYAQPSDPYALAWGFTDAGGGLVAAGAYNLTNIIGQPEAGPTQTGGGYSLNGGIVNAGSSGAPASPAYRLYAPLVVR